MLRLLCKPAVNGRQIFVTIYFSRDGDRNKCLQNSGIGGIKPLAFRP
jgi:hypothetical protein